MPNPAQIAIRFIRFLAAAALLGIIVVLLAIVLFYRGDDVLYVALPALIASASLGVFLFLRRTKRTSGSRSLRNCSAAVRALARLSLAITLRRSRCSSNAAQLLYDSGVMLTDQCRYREAAEKLNASAEMFCELDDRQHQALALMELGSCENAAGHHQSAVSALHRALALWEQLSERQREDNTWRLLNNMAVALTERGDLELAEIYCRRALSAAQLHHPEGHPATAMCMLNLADVYRRGQRFPDAKELLSQSLEILDTAKDDNYAFGVSLLAMFHEDQGSFKEAGELYRQSLELMEQQFGANHTEVARLLDRHGAMLERAGREKEGASLRARAASIQATIG